MEHTPTPWRIGDAGITIFGPPNGNPSPETVATSRNKANVAHIVKCVNVHETLIKALKAVSISLIDDEHYQEFKPLLKTVTDAINLAEGK